MQKSQYHNVSSLNDCSYMKPLPENLKNICVESTIMYKGSYSFRNDSLLIDLQNDWTDIENKNEWKIYPTRIPKRLQYFKGSFEEPTFDNCYEFANNEPTEIDEYLFEDIPEIPEISVVENLTKKVNIDLENISEDDSYDCCSLWSIDDTFCTCEETSINKQDSINTTTDKAFDEEHKSECIVKTNINDQDLKEISSSTDTSSCQSEIASPIFEVISSSNHKKDFYLELENSCPKVENSTHVSIINKYCLVFMTSKNPLY